MDGVSSTAMGMEFHKEFDSESDWDIDLVLELDVQLNQEALPVSSNRLASASGGLGARHWAAPLWLLV